MALTSADLQWFRSSTGDSEGGTRSGTQIVGSSDNNLFPNILDAARIAGGSRTRKVFLFNASASDPIVQPVIWQSVTMASVVESFGLGFDDSNDDDTDQAILVDWSAAAICQVVSDGADTRRVDIYGTDGTGIGVTERITLNGSTPVSGSQSFTHVHGVHTIDGPSMARTISIKQGAGGTVRATIPISQTAAWRWITATSKVAGMRLPNLGAGETYGVWRQQVWSAGAGAIRGQNPPDSMTAQEA